MAKKTQSPINPKYPEALESMDGIEYDTLLVVLAPLNGGSNLVRVGIDWIELPPGKVFSPQMYEGGLKTVETWINAFRLRIQRVDQAAGL